jgi:hypothetical protein
VREAARRLHDEHIGVGNVFHLFRLPEEIELELHKLIEEQTGMEEYFHALIGKQEALAALIALAEGNRAVAEGPISLGKVDEVLATKTLKEMARCYVAAFNEGVRTYPYLLRDRERA